MKIKHLLIGMLAMAASVACNRTDEPEETPKLEVDKATVEVAATAGEASFNVTSNQNWVASADADWVSLEPASGAASEKAVAVKVTAEDNETTEAREATVTVKAGELSKTVKVKQAAGQGGETPGPELQQSEWALVGTFNEWSAGSELYLSVLDEEYFVYYGFELAANDEFKFLKGGAWPPAGTEIGGNGLVEPNTIQPAGGSNIKVTEAGKYDIYLAADLTKFYVMSEGKLPAEAVEPAPVENSWGMMGCFVDNQWSTDVPMTKEGEWIVAKGAQFTELTFKIRANQSWADGTNIGVAPGSERGYVNAKVSVVTAEYSKANCGGDAADIKLDGEPGTYDVYFSFENLEVYVMEQGAKPGEKDPIIPETPAEITYTVVGTLDGINWSNNAPEGLMVKEGDYYVGKNIPLVTAATLYGGANQIEFKVVETGTWNGYAHANKENENFINAEIPVVAGGENIIVKGAEGAYDVYLDKANGKVWVMEPGFKPGEKEPVIPETPAEDVYRVTGTIADNAWNPTAEIGLMVAEGDYLVAKNLPLLWGRTIYDDNSNPIEFKITKNGGWDGYGEAADVVSAANTEIALAAGGDNIVVDAPEGTYDVYFDKANAKVWVMNAGLKPGETPAPEYTLDGKQWLLQADGTTILVDLGLYEEGAMVIALPTMDESGFACYMYGTYEIEKADAKSGKIIFTQYDPEWDEFLDPVEYPYSELAEDVVYLAMPNVPDADMPSPYNAVSEPYEIIFDNLGGEDPSGAIENGEYWFFNGDKVMAPMAEDATSGVMPANDIINGASTAKNIFTLTYDPDMSYYTIQDSYGRYLGNESWGNDISLTTVLPSGEDYAYYLWSVDTGFDDGTFDIYNAASYNGFAYSAADNNWYLDPASYETDGIRPTLVLAENPVEEPVEPEGPQAISVADFLKLSVGTTEYQLTGVMEGTYNTTYGNFYLNDGTGKVLVYGLTATKQTSNDKSFASLGLKDGDTITIIGTRAVYNGTAQVGGPAYLVSCEKTAAWDAPAISFVNNIVTLVSNEGAAIYYTLDGTTPSESSQKYSEPFEIQETVTVNAIAVKEGRPNSSVATKECEYVEISDDVVVGGAADFATISATNTSYVTGTTTAGWNYKNCAIFKGGTSDSSPAFKMIGDASNRALCMNGKTSAVGSITSPTLTTGCGTLTFNYGLPFSDTKIKFRVDIMQNGSVVKTFTINNASATKLTKYSHSEAINVSGDFQIVFTNLSPSNSTSNKDRTAIWDVEWTGYKE